MESEKLDNFEHGLWRSSIKKPNRKCSIQLINVDSVEVQAFRQQYLNVIGGLLTFQRTEKIIKWSFLFLHTVPDIPLVYFKGGFYTQIYVKKSGNTS